MSSFTRKQLRFTFTIGDDTVPFVFPGTTSNTLRVEGLRATLDIENAGQQYPSARVRIFGMRQEDMNLLPFFGTPLNNINAIANIPCTMQAETNIGDGWLTVFSGQIITAGPDYSASPDVCLSVDAQALYRELLNPSPPRSYPGTVTVAEIASAIAAFAHCSFENAGVTKTLTNQYLPSTVAAQLRAVADAAGVDLYIDVTTQPATVVLCNRGQSREGAAVLINPQSGLMGYPTMSGIGPNLDLLYNPALRIAGSVTIESKYSIANGSWFVYQLNHSLSSEMPQGPWLTALKCSRHQALLTPQP